MNLKENSFPSFLLLNPAWSNSTFGLKIVFQKKFELRNINFLKKSITNWNLKKNKIY